MSVYVKGCKPDDLNLDVSEQALHLRINKAGSSTGELIAELHLEPLFASIDTSNSGLRVLGSKIEVSLPKAAPGVRWSALTASTSASSSAAPPAPAGGAASQAAGPSSASAVPSSTMAAASAPAPPASRPTRSKWDSFKDDDEDEDAREGAGAGAEGGGGGGGDAGIDAFFKKLYADADDDTRRAMMKSYQESGGTALSTNWAEVQKSKVETRPPDGMEARKW